MLTARPTVAIITKSATVASRLMITSMRILASPFLVSSCRRARAWRTVTFDSRLFGHSLLNQRDESLSEGTDYAQQGAKGSPETLGCPDAIWRLGHCSGTDPSTYRESVLSAFGRLGQR